MSIHNPFDINVFDVFIQEPADPATGAQFVTASPLNSRAMVAALAFVLITDANVANRQASIQRAASPNNHRFAADPIDATASTTAFYTGGIGLGTGIGTNPLHHVFSLPPIPMFVGGDDLRISIVGLQATDRIEDILITWHIWKFPQ